MQVEFAPWFLNVPRAKACTCGKWWLFGGQLYTLLHVARRGSRIIRRPLGQAALTVFGSDRVEFCAVSGAEVLELSVLHEA